MLLNSIGGTASDVQSLIAAVASIAARNATQEQRSEVCLMAHIVH